MLNVTLFVSPGCKFLVLNVLSIAECAVVPAFIQVTVVPTFTFISFGVNSNSFIVTVGLPGVLRHCDVATGVEKQGHNAYEQSKKPGRRQNVSPFL